MPNWNQVFNEIGQHRAQHAAHAHQAVDEIRRKYLKQLFERTERNVIAYYSGFLSRPGVGGQEINDKDKNGFMMAVHGLDRAKGLDLILHTPGGGIAATQSLVHYLQLMFKRDLRAIVPQIAMSAGTMIACSCRSIVMATHSNLGPIDPHLRGIPAYGVVQEFRRAFREVKKDPVKRAIWEPILSQYRPTFLSQCENAIKLANNFVAQQLQQTMFEGDANAARTARAVTRKLSDYRGNKTHDRHIHIDECRAMGLQVERLESDAELQDLVLTVHHCFMHTLMNTLTHKIIENQNGTAFAKTQVQMAVPTAP
jgi:ClpP class serine protease